jgi:choline-sulfatase
LFVSFVAPHFPLTAPPEYFYRYAKQALPWPKQYNKHERPAHPYLNDYRNSFCYDDYFGSRDDVQKALAGYFGLVSLLDEHIGKILQVLDDTGLAANTDVLYTSDHGDNLGSRGLWGKSTMYEEVAGVPLIACGPSFPSGHVVNTPVSHVDALPTILQSVGMANVASASDYPGVSLIEIAHGLRPTRNVLSEYHGMGSTTAAYMLRTPRYKYVHYAKYPAQLFDLQTDPEELMDLGSDPARASELRACEAQLLQMLDPVEVDRQAKERQASLLAQHGGRAAVLARGDIGFTPAPGVAADFQ